MHNAGGVLGMCGRFCCMHVRAGVGGCAPDSMPPLPCRAIGDREEEVGPRVRVIVRVVGFGVRAGELCVPGGGRELYTEKLRVSGGAGARALCPPAKE